MENQREEVLNRLLEDDEVTKLPSFMTEDGKIVVIMTVLEHAEIKKILDAKIKNRTKYRDNKRGEGKRSARRTKDITFAELSTRKDTLV